MTNRACRTMLRGFVLLGVTMLAVPDVRAQDRSPNFPFGYCYPDNTGQNIIEWQGGDSPYSVYIQPNYSFWTWSDTYVNPAGSTTRSANHVHNTIAIGQTVNSNNAGTFTPYYFDSGTYQAPGAFFPDPYTKYSFRPRRPIMINGKLYVFLHVYYDGASPSQFLGNFVARVNNPTANPTAWQVDYIALATTGVGTTCPLVFGLEAQLFGTDANNLYVYGLYTGSSNPVPMVITLDLNTLATLPNNGNFPQSKAQYLAAYDGVNPTFGPGFGQPASGQSPNYFNTAINPFYYSLRYNATAKKWQVVGCLGLQAGPAVAPPDGSAPADQHQSAYVFMSQTPFGPFIGGNSNNSPLRAFAEFDPSYDTASNQSNQGYKYVYCAREWVDPSLTNDYQIAMTYTYSNVILATTINDNLTYTTRFASVTNPLMPPPSNQAMASPRGRTSGFAVQQEQPVAWEDTPGAAAMPRPRPVPVLGYTPVEQRNPWEISPDGQREGHVAPRAVGKLKVR